MRYLSLTLPHTLHFRSFHHSEDASVVIPIGCMAQQYSQYVRTDTESPYQTSAAIALAIETAEGALILL
jgi:hypothetical protein